MISVLTGLVRLGEKAVAIPVGHVVTHSKQNSNVRT